MPLIVDVRGMDPNYLNAGGQSLALIGGLLLAIDALAPKELVEHLDGTDEWEARKASLGYQAGINSTFVYLLVSAIGLALLLALLPMRDVAARLVSALLIAPLTYPAWKLLIRACEMLQGAVRTVSPARARNQSLGGLGSMMHLALALVWLALYVPVSLLTMLVRFGVDLPLRFLAERIVGRHLLRLLRWVANKQEGERRFHFRQAAFTGVVFVLAGFAYQLVATILILRQP
jgi:hypothetical protein